MISIILPINHKDRVGQANNLYQMLKKDSGAEIEVIVACDNPEIYEDLQADILVRIPKRIEFTQSVNIGEKFAKYPHVWYMDDSVTPVKDWARTALKAFYERFPDGKGLMEISGVENCATRCITTRSFVYSLNGNNLLWPEYIHCGDAELYERTMPNNQFYLYPEILLQEQKINDDSRKRNMKVFRFDDMIREERRAKGFSSTLMSDWQERLFDYCKNDEDLLQLYKNIFNL